MAKLEYLGTHSSETSLKIPYYLDSVQAGFPSPADDYMDKKLDLNEHLIAHPAATFYCRVSGSSMQSAGIFDGDLLIVDRSLEPEHMNIVVAIVDGEMTCKIIDTHKCCLLAANDAYPAIPIDNDTSMIIEGVVIHSIRSHRRVRTR
ncbi:MAG: translesion error-prone DNA polymerase V autoproteolytic subunit [Gammaproteobacteria bacterium]|nr:translesion error-prone DNA polymerase V autoproteolytic subunit [Gammaproteobacteria bacterium]MCY4219453.1 translesion error-prone DNA polymerase V autoproteolytic subunit [Gammaproteobacteria bacterium]